MDPKLICGVLGTKSHDRSARVLILHQMHYAGAFYKETYISG
jgi:hypothetical protein